MAKGNVVKDCDLMHLTISNLVEQHKDISRNITNALDKSRVCTQRSKLSELVTSNSVKAIFCNLLFFLHTLFIAIKMFNVKRKKFKEKTETLLTECLVSGSMKRFQEYCYNYHQYKIGQKDGQHYLYFCHENKPVLWCDNLIPLLEGLVAMISEIIKSHCSNCKTSTCKVCFKKKDLLQKLEAISSFAPKTNAVDKEKDSQYDEFLKEIKSKFNELNKYKVEKLKKPAGKTNYCLIYMDQEGNIKHTFFNDTVEALKWCYRNKSSIEKELPVVLVTNIYTLHPHAVRKKKVREVTLTVGRECSPEVKAIIKIPNNDYVKEQQPPIFYIDTGADGGSIGYNCEFLKGFIFSMEEIEDEMKPVVFGQISIEGSAFQEIQSFDVDRNPIWNALGMEQIKHYDFFYSRKKNGLSILVNPDTVQLIHCDSYAKIVITSESPQLLKESRQPESSSLVDNHIHQQELPEAKASNLHVAEDCDADSLGPTTNPNSSQAVDHASFQIETATSPEITADTNSALTSVDNSSFSAETEIKYVPKL